MLINSNPLRAISVKVRFCQLPLTSFESMHIQLKYHLIHLNGNFFSETVPVQFPCRSQGQKKDFLPTPRYSGFLLLILVSLLKKQDNKLLFLIAYYTWA